MTKTVKQIVDEYLNRQKTPEFDSILFQYPEDGRLEQHSEVSNLYRDGVLVTELNIDSDFHKYQLDRTFESWDETIPAKTIRYTFRGRVLRYSKRIEE